MFAEKFIETRKQAGLNQTETAKLLGVSQAAIVKWEKGNAEPSLKTLVKISDTFNVSLDYLMRENPINKNEQIEAILRDAGLRIINDVSQKNIYNYKQ